MSTTEKRFRLNIKEWADAFQSEFECADYCKRVAERIYNEAKTFNDKMHEHFQRFPEAVAILEANVVVNVSLCGAAAARFEVGVKEGRKEEE